jgi:hypothetical protein
MPQGVQSSFGVQRLIDAQQRWARASFPVYLRLRNFPDVQGQQWAQLGFRIAPSGGPVGVTDILIDPPPGVRMVSIHNIGMSAGKLRFGARIFQISATFVNKQVVAQGLTDQNLVWRGPNVVGLVSEELLFSIEDIKHAEYSGQTISWQITANANEIR